uniref:Uncharacterized protein n=1 Tax=Solanum lycopersicum TaxID=4081 RepID=A0A3Q7I6L5_SOLLC
MWRVSAMLKNLMRKRIIPTTSKRKMSDHVEPENVIKDSSGKISPADFPTITSPPITVPTDATAVPESQFVPDFDADPPIRPGDNDDDQNESNLEVSTPQPEAADEKPPPF